MLLDVKDFNIKGAFDDKPVRNDATFKSFDKSYQIGRAVIKSKKIHLKIKKKKKQMLLLFVIIRSGQLINVRIRLLFTCKLKSLIPVKINSVSGVIVFRSLR